ncbi:MAG: acyl-CoA thioester hydrolase [Gaiellales bacterium]|nr:acyl-CoA thioester hydrolase [Gaiellales bacterium]
MIYAPPAGPTDALPPFRFSAFMRVGFDETDAQAVVYYGRYLPYFDRSRVEYQRHLGLLGVLPEGRQFVMRRSSQEYEAPARFDDLLEVFVRTARIGRTSTTLEYRVRKANDETLLAVAEQVMVLIDAESRRPFEVPASWRASIERFEGAV